MSDDGCKHIWQTLPVLTTDARNNVRYAAAASAILLNRMLRNDSGSVIVVWHPDAAEAAADAKTRALCLVHVRCNYNVVIEMFTPLVSYRDWGRIAGPTLQAVSRIRHVPYSDPPLIGMIVFMRTVANLERGLGDVASETVRAVAYDNLRVRFARKVIDRMVAQNLGDIKAKLWNPRGRLVKNMVAETCG